LVRFLWGDEAEDAALHRLSYVPTPKHRPLTMSVRADSLAQFGEVGKDAGAGLEQER
jgi:hypothetical protein